MGTGMEINSEQFLSWVVLMVKTYAPKLVVAIVLWFVGAWVIRALVNGLSVLLKRRDVDPSLSSFLSSVAGILLRVMLVITVLSMLGIEMTSFIAILGAAGLAVGMALSGTLQNFAGGVMILLFKPFKVGDVIEAQGFVGGVSEIQIFNTVLKTPDNKTIIIPNGGLSTSSMTNYSTEEKRRVDLTITIAYGEDVEKAKSILRRICDEDVRILKQPEAFVAVSELGTLGVSFTVRTWAMAQHYFDVLFQLNERIYQAFKQENILFPIPPDSKLRSR